MQFVCEVPHRSANTQSLQQSQLEESDENRIVINTTQTNPVDAHSRTPLKFRCGCLQSKVTKFMGICITGLTVLVGGSVLIVLYFTSFEYRGFLIPALCLFILGIALTSIGEWYCRTSLHRRQQARRRQRSRHRIRRSSTCRNQEDSELPPSYYSLQRLPTTHISNGGYSPTAETSSNQFEPIDNDLPKYSAIKTNDNEVLPSYQEATKTEFQTGSADKE